MERFLPKPEKPERANIHDIPGNELVLFNLAVENGNINLANAIIKNFIEKQAGVIGSSGEKPVEE